MMSDEVTTLAVTGKSETPQFKRTTGTRREAVQTCAQCSTNAAGMCCSVASPQEM